MDASLSSGDQVVVERHQLHSLLDALREHGYQPIGPTIRDGVIVYDTLSSVADLPIGWTDEQDGGTYRLKRRADEACFGYVVGPHSWKQFLHPPTARLWRATRSGGEIALEAEHEAPPKYACIGVRPCELRAIAIQDRIFLQGPFVDTGYQARREQVFLVAVNCGEPGGTCFCASMHSGPRAISGFDLALTEILEADRHYFVVEIGSEQGAEVVHDIPHTPATPDELAAAARLIEQATRRMGRTLDTEGLKPLLYQSYEHPVWDEVAERCLACGNCTLVCPTCFCTTIEDHTDLAGNAIERVSKWDSCFSLDFTHTAGGSTRTSVRARYRQWMLHKLATWIDQFGESGCVGCGRCITWCPVGIDITEEARFIRERRAGTRSTSNGGGS